MPLPDLPYAFVARLVAAPGAGDRLQQLLTDTQVLAEQEAGTPVWFAVRTDATTFWLFDAFATEDDRTAHAKGAIADALDARSELLAEPPEILPAAVLASKLP
jgi:hypothetical protein